MSAECDVQRRVSRSVELFCVARGLSAGEFAEWLNMAPSTLYSKLSGARRWTLEDIAVLERMGVKVPSLSEKKGARS